MKKHYSHITIRICHQDPHRSLLTSWPQTWNCECAIIAHCWLVPVRWQFAVQFIILMLHTIWICICISSKYDNIKKSNLVQLMHIFPKNNWAKFHPDPSWKNRALGSLKSFLINKNNKKLTSALRSVSDPKCWSEWPKCQCLIQQLKGKD